MTSSINNAYLLAMFGGSTGGTTFAPRAAKAQPTPPWQTTATPPEPTALLRSALAGRRLIDENAARLDVSSAPADYRKLFAVYQGLQSLQALADRAGVKSLTANELVLVEKRFQSGLSEVSSYLGQAKLEGVRLTAGTVSATAKTSAAVTRDSAVSRTSPVHEGQLSDVVKVFEGDVAFNISIRARATDAVTQVAVDLSDMGADARTLPAVVNFINTKLQDAGVETRLGTKRIPAEPRVLTANGRTISLPAGADRWALEVQGISTEIVGFSAAQSSDAVYVSQKTARGQELLKFMSDGGTAAEPTGGGIGQTNWVESRVAQGELPEGVSRVRATASAADGGVWMLADVTAGPDGQPIKGQSDVALMRFDSAGRLMMTQTLGAASAASGMALAVADDGRVAVAGSVSGGLVAGERLPSGTTADSFVTVFDAEGSELWTQRRGARAEDEATAVSFGADGQLIVAGRARSGMPGQSALGGWDAYVQVITESQVHSLAPKTPSAGQALQFGTGSDDSVSAVAVDGDRLFTAGVENGRLTVRRFVLDGNNTPLLEASRDLGAASGSVAGLSVRDGNLVLAGTTLNGALDVAVTNGGHSGGTDGFVARMSDDLTATASDTVTYLGDVGDDTIADMKVVDGKVWLTGVANRAPDAKDADPTRAYLSRLDVQTGAVEWRREWSGEGGQASPMSLATVTNGASILDRLGLPKGEITQTSSKALVDATALRAGDRFSVSPAGGGRAVTVTIDAKDTLQTLARKIETASGRRLKVTVSSVSAQDPKQGDEAATRSAGVQKLTITARDGSAGAVLNVGEAGRDALAGLGLSPGFIGPTSGKDDVKAFGLDLGGNLNVATADAAKTALSRIQMAMSAVRSAYRALAPRSPSANITGEAPAYLSAQIANYQAALNRLGG